MPDSVLASTDDHLKIVVVDELDYVVFWVRHWK